MHATTTAPQYHRGVYTLPFTDAAGNPLAVAISTDGRCLAQLPYQPDTKPDALRALWSVVNATDPQGGA